MISYEEALKRTEQLIGIAAGPSAFSHADFDELETLAKYLGDKLPGKFHEILAGGYSGSTYAVQTMGERLQRVLSLHAKMPEEFTKQGALGTESESLLPVFELNKKDKERVLKLCSDMRKIVFASADFDEPHKKRLLNRIAAIEKQVLSPKGLFDVVLGGVSDVGETLGKFGKDIKPLTDRMNEVAKITRDGTKEYDQLPSPEEIKGLPAPEEDSGGHD